MRIIDASDKDFHFVVAVTDDGRMLFAREPVARGHLLLAARLMKAGKK